MMSYSTKLIGLLLAAVVLLGGLGIGLALSTSGPTDSELESIHNDLPGDGTVDNPWQVSDVEELQSIHWKVTEEWEDVADSDDDTIDPLYYELTDDINASVTVDWYNGDGFEPIGQDTNGFVGELDGQGYEIHDLHIDRSSSDTALFATLTSNDQIETTTVHNVGVVDADITTENRGAAVVGMMRYDTVLNNVYATGDVVTDEMDASQRTIPAEAGGLAAFVSGGDITDSYASVNVVNNDGDDGTVGGLVGLVGDGRDDSAATIDNSFIASSVSGGAAQGTVVGQGPRDLWSSQDVDDVEFDNIVYNTDTADGDAVGLGYDDYESDIDGVNTNELMGNDLPLTDEPYDFQDGEYPDLSANPRSDDVSMLGSSSVVSYDADDDTDDYLDAAVDEDDQIDDDVDEDVSELQEDEINPDEDVTEEDWEDVTDEDEDEEQGLVDAALESVPSFSDTLTVLTTEPPELSAETTVEDDTDEIEYVVPDMRVASLYDNVAQETPLGDRVPVQMFVSDENGDEEIVPVYVDEPDDADGTHAVYDTDRNKLTLNGDFVAGENIEVSTTPDDFGFLTRISEFGLF